MPKTKEAIKRWYIIADGTPRFLICDGEDPIGCLCFEDQIQRTDSALFISATG
jgi:hypothetical protein